MNMKKRGADTKSADGSNRIDKAKTKAEEAKPLPSVDFMTLVAAEIMRREPSPNVSFVRAASIWNASLEEIDKINSDNPTLTPLSAEDVTLLASKLYRPEETAHSAVRRALELRQICSEGLSGSPITSQLAEAANSSSQVPFRKFLKICYPTGKYDDQVKKWRDFQRKCTDGKKHVDWHSLNNEEEIAIGKNQPYGKALAEFGPDDFARIDQIISEKLKDDRETGIDLAFSLMIANAFVEFLRKSRRDNYLAKGDKGQRAKRLNKITKQLIDGEDLNPDEVELLKSATADDLKKIIAKHGLSAEDVEKLRSAIERR